VQQAWVRAWCEDVLLAWFGITDHQTCLLPYLLRALCDESPAIVQVRLKATQPLLIYWLAYCLLACASLFSSDRKCCAALQGTFAQRFCSDLLTLPSAADCAAATGAAGQTL
jgi:hypothetical protein